MTTQNRDQFAMLHSAIVVVNNLKEGRGLVARERIPVGTAIWFSAADSIIVSRSALDALPSEVRSVFDEFGYSIADGSIIWPGGGAHYLNHSCDANVLDFGLDFGLSVQEIKDGDQITIDYRTFDAESDWHFRCYCESRDCCGVVRSNIHRSNDLTAKWSKLILAAARQLPFVKQPLHHSLMSGSEAYRKLNAGDVTWLSSSDVSITSPQNRRQLTSFICDTPSRDI